MAGWTAPEDTAGRREVLDPRWPGDEQLSGGSQEQQLEARPAALTAPGGR